MTISPTFPSLVAGQSRDSVAHTHVAAAAVAAHRRAAVARAQGGR